MTSIASIMTQNVIAVRADNTLREVIATLDKHNISGVPVVSEDGTMVGMISDLALMDVLFDSSLANEPVADYMTEEVHFLSEEESLTRAVHMFALYGIRQLPVVRGQELVGMVTRRNLLHHAAHSDDTLIEPLTELMPGFDQVDHEIS